MRALSAPEFDVLALIAGSNERTVDARTPEGAHLDYMAELLIQRGCLAARSIGYQAVQVKVTELGYIALRVARLLAIH